jgi:hypothetical protein
MDWYWILLIVVGCQAVFLLLLWLALRKTVGQIPFKELQASNSQKYQEQIEAEKIARGKAEEELRTLAAEQKKILDWWKQAEGKVNREVQDAFKELVSDPSALDRKLDSLLSGNSEDATPTGGST